MRDFLNITWVDRDSDEGRTEKYPFLPDEEYFTLCQIDFGERLSSDFMVSAYPLAEWFVSSWWRLFHEPERLEPDFGWKLNHDLPAAAKGYLWPSIRFTPSQLNVSICDIGTGEVFELFPKSRLIELVDRFVSQVLARLEEKGYSQTDLHYQFAQLKEEREDSITSFYRRNEASQGYDLEYEPNDTESFFNFLKDLWYKETASDKNVERIVTHPAYRGLIHLGEKILPFIFKGDLDNRTIILLLEIVGDAPFKQNPMSSETMKQDYLIWAKEKGYLA